MRRQIFILSASLALLLGAARATPPTPAVPAPAQALLISDTHFDPFQDPAKAAPLAAAPVSGWQRILSAAPSPTQAADFAALQQKCGAKAGDTDYALLNRTLASIRQNAAAASFITLSGDLLAHRFPCRFQNALPKATPADYAAFVEKTIEFQAAQIRAALPRAVLYIALGNNDSDCDDYKLDVGTPFLKEVARVVGLSIGAAWTSEAARDLSDGGYYSVQMAAPMQNTRLVVLDDIFFSASYATCGGKPDPAPATRQLDWLRAQLADARLHHQHIWVMGHIPTGVNPYATLKSGHEKLCGPNGAPKMFLANEDLADTLAAAQPNLVLFAHTHMDEMRLLAPGAEGTASPGAPVKLVPSISPVNGNRPSFTVALVDPTTATLDDYTVYAATDNRGTNWQREYNFNQTYTVSGFTAPNLQKIIRGFTADPAGVTPASQAYLRNFTSGALTDELKPFWADYTCALTSDHALDFLRCACGH